MKKNYIITGASGFIAQHFVKKIFNENTNNIVVAIDKKETKTNYNKNYFFYKNDLSKYSNSLYKKINRKINRSFRTEFWHFAANSDISKGVKNQDIDFNDTFMTTINSIKYSKLLDIEKFIFSSTAAIYGDNDKKLNEDTIPRPISNYGAYKLASESIIYGASTGSKLKFYIFRFANVIGPNVTHGIIFDFFKKIKQNKKILKVLGDGNQTKPYIYIEDLISAMNFVTKKSKSKFNLYLIGPDNSHISVNKIANIFCSIVSPNTKIKFENKKRGWLGDVIKYRYDIKKIKSLGWKPEFSSKDSVIKTIKSFL